MKYRAVVECQFDDDTTSTVRATEFSPVLGGAMAIALSMALDAKKKRKAKKTKPRVEEVDASGNTLRVAWRQ